MKTNIGISDDYAIVYTQGKKSWDRDKEKPSFYYGYEEVDDYDEWMFKVTIGNKVICQYSTSELIEKSGRGLSEGDNMDKFLIQGMYLFCLYK